MSYVRVNFLSHPVDINKNLGINLIQEPTILTPCYLMCGINHTLQASDLLDWSREWAFNHYQGCNHLSSGRTVALACDGIKKAIWERVEKPSLNKKGWLPFQLISCMGQGIKLISSHLSHDQSSGSVAWKSVVDTTHNVASCQNIKFQYQIYSQIFT